MKRSLALLVLATWTALAPVARGACVGSPQLHEATPSSLAAYVQRTGKKVLTFTGYSAAGYQDAQRMRELATRILAATDPRSTLVNIGATVDGIGEVYELAKAAGFSTIGVVSSLARREAARLSPCVDHVFFVEDTTWGGRSAATGQLSPTSQAIVNISNSLVGLGGGDIARDELLAAQSRGRAVTFIPADMNHQIARARAERRNEAPPKDFRGSAHAALHTGI